MVCDCEQVLQSEFSPGLVKNDEDIVYCLIDPDLFDRAAGTLKNKAFSKTDLRKTSLSVVRQRYSSDGEVEEMVIAPQVSRNPQRQFCGVLVCECVLIRSINDISEQEICVADAGLEGFNSHAHLGFSNEITGKSKSVQEAARSNLVATFQTRGIVGLEAVFDR